MVCAVSNFHRLNGDNKGIELEKIVSEIIDRRDSAAEILFFPNYFKLIATENLPDQILLVNGLVLESSELDDRYRLISGNNFSDPNYEQLQYMLQGLRRNIQREIKYRQNQEA